MAECLCRDKKQLNLYIKIKKFGYNRIVKWGFEVRII